MKEEEKGAQSPKTTGAGGCKRDGKGEAGSTPAIMGQEMIPCLLMRGGTSRGTFFLKEHLPRDKGMLDQVSLQLPLPLLNTAYSHLSP